MKKIVLLLAVLLLAMPAMAEVTVTCSAVSNVVTVSYTGGGAGGVRAFGLDVSLSDGAVISNVTRLSAGYYVAPGSVSVSGTVINSNIVASNSYPGTKAGAGTSEMTIEMGSLYVGEANAPAASGDLFSFEVSVPCTITLATNDIRGGVVMEDPEVSSGLSGTISTCSSGSYATGCKYDGDNDGYIVLDDLYNILNLLLPTDPDWYIECSGANCIYDGDGDDYIVLDDLYNVLNLLLPTDPDWYTEITWTCPY